MKVNLKGLFANVASDARASRREYNQFCLDEVYGHIQDVLDGRHTIEEFADHYCMTRTPSHSESNKVKPGEHGIDASRAGRCE